jgi:hypothetical protein
MKELKTLKTTHKGLFGGSCTQYVTVFKDEESGDCFLASTVHTFDAGWESMVFATTQEPPENPEDADMNLVTSWTDLAVQHYPSEPTLEQHEEFIHNFLS